jgi:hypothetical protein
MRTPQVDISDAAADGLKDLQRLFGLKTYRDLLQHAFVILSWVAAETQEGHAIISTDPKTGMPKGKLELAALDRAAANPDYNPRIRRLIEDFKEEFAAALK